MKLNKHYFYESYTLLCLFLKILNPIKNSAYNMDIGTHNMFFFPILSMAS